MKLHDNPTYIAHLEEQLRIYMTENRVLLKKIYDLENQPEHKCETCKWNTQLISAGCSECWNNRVFKKDNWEPKDGQ